MPKPGMVLYLHSPIRLNGVVLNEAKGQFYLYNQFSSRMKFSHNILHCRPPQGGTPHALETTAVNEQI
jgi:hypothetical protein